LQTTPISRAVGIVIISGVALLVLSHAAGGASRGISTQQARTAAPITLDGGPNDEGTSLSFARADHRHAISGLQTDAGLVARSANLGPMVSVDGGVPTLSVNGSPASGYFYQAGAPLNFHVLITDLDNPGHPETFFQQNTNGAGVVAGGFWPFEIYGADKAGGGGNARPLVSVGPIGGMGIWDYLVICPRPNGQCDPGNGSMLAVGSDGTANATTVAFMNNSTHHDIMQLNDWNGGTGSGGPFDSGIRRLTVTKDGFQNSTLREIERRTSAPPDCGGATLNLSVAQFLESHIFTCGTAQTINFPTWQGSSGIVQSLPGVPHVGDVVSVIGAATAANALTLGFGTGGTNGNPGHTTIPGNSTQTITCRLTSVTANSETATCY
jgi:hypothetical protein